MTEAFRGRLLSEPISPGETTLEMGALASGEPGVPRSFVWRGSEHRVGQVLRRWRATRQCRSTGKPGPGPYVYRHYYALRMADGAEWTVYLERQPKGGERPGWWLYTVTQAGDGPSRS